MPSPIRRMPVKVETVILTGSSSRGFAAKVLARESRHAAMLCVGAVGMGRLAGSALGSTTRTLTRRASCPVAIVSKRDLVRVADRGGHRPVGRRYSGVISCRSVGSSSLTVGWMCIVRASVS